MKLTLDLCPCSNDSLVPTPMISCCFPVICSTTNGTKEYLRSADRHRRIKPQRNPTCQENIPNRRLGSQRKRIRPIQELNESSDDDDRRDQHGRKRVPVIDCLLESSSPEDNQMESQQQSKIDLMKNSSETLALTFAEFCHIRNVITRAELETLLFDDKLYNEVAQSKLCFTCRKVHFHILTFTFGVHCHVCKQKVCRNCLTQIALPKVKTNDLPIYAFTPLTLTQSFTNADRYRSLDVQSPMTPTMTDMLNDFENDEGESRRYSTPGQSLSAVEPINICTDCFFLLQQIRKKSRQRHVAPVISSKLVPSRSSSTVFNRVRQSNSSHHLSTSSSSSSIAALLAKQRSLMVKTTSLHSNLKQTKSVQDLCTINDALQSSMVKDQPGTTDRVTLPRDHLFLKLQPAYDSRLNQVKTG